MGSYILILEPDKILSSQYKIYLDSYGYIAKIANSAEAAIALADKQTPALIIMEIFLKNHSGVEFLYEFRSYSEWQDVPVIILSRIAESDLGLNESSKKILGINKVLYKHDTSLQKLASHVEDFLDVPKDQRRASK